MKLEFYGQIFEKYPKYPLLLSDLNKWNCNFIDRFSKSTQITRYYCQI